MANKTANLVLVGKNRLYRECLASLLGEIEPFTVFAETDDLGQAAAALGHRPAAMLLVDLGSMEEEAVSELRGFTRTFPEVRVIVLGLPRRDREILRCLEAGARGYTLRESSTDELRETIDRVARGEVVCAPELHAALFSCLAELARGDRRSVGRLEGFDLSLREMEVLELIAEDLSNQQIADRLCLSLYTVKNHVHSILTKLQVKDRRAAVAKIDAGRPWSPHAAGRRRHATRELNRLTDEQ